MTVSNSRITVPLLRRFKEDARKIAALTAYDYTSACLLDEAGIDLILVGDSLAMVMQGLETTIPVTLDEMVYHCKCVSRGVKRALVVGDMPFGSYQSSTEQAVDSAVRMIKEGMVSAVKLEGGVRAADAIGAIVSADIPVLAHIGMTPQSFHRMGGYKVQGRKESRCPSRTSAEQVMEDARAVEDAGAFGVVLECVPAELASQITSTLSIPTIGIGGGTACDGQILVMQDMLGLTSKKLTFVRRFAELGAQIKAAAGQYAQEVRECTFPAKDESFHTESDRS